MPVHFNPQNPQQSVLEPGGSVRGAWILGGGMALVVLVVVVVGVILLVARRRLEAWRMKSVGQAPRR